MFSFFKKTKEVEVCAVVKGKVKNLNEVTDPVFANGLAGRGLVIVPEEEIFRAPCDGILSAVFPTGHAFGITDEKGMEYLIHIGIDTVSLNGEGFQCFVSQGNPVKKGDALVQVDLKVLENKQLSSDTMVLVSTPEEQCEITFSKTKGDKVCAGDTLFLCKKK